MNGNKPPRTDILDELGLYLIEKKNAQPCWTPLRDIAYAIGKAILGLDDELTEDDDDHKHERICQCSKEPRKPCSHC